MFIILNRWRGTYSIFAKINGSILSLLVYLITFDVYVALLTGIGYIAGESMGWGEWIGGIINNSKSDPLEYEGKNNGIRYLASKIYDPIMKYQKFCRVALTIRGIYWFILTYIFLALFGYLDFSLFILSIIFLGVMFPISVIIGKYTTKIFNYESKWFNMIGAWEHAEVWYGLAQDIVFIIVLLNITC